MKGNETVEHLYNVLAIPATHPRVRRRCATRSEYERKRKLVGQDQNVSASAVEEATAAMKKDDAAHAAARAKTVAQWGRR